MRGRDAATAKGPPAVRASWRRGDLRAGNGASERAGTPAQGRSAAEQRILRGSPQARPELINNISRPGVRNVDEASRRQSLAVALVDAKANRNAG